MWSFFRRRILIIILVSIILLVTLIGFTIRDRDQVSLPEEFLKDTIGWVQGVFQVPINIVTNFFTDVDDLKETYEQNRVLKARLSEYKDLLYEVQALEKDNQELRAMLDLKETDNIRKFNPIQATVNGRSPELWFQQLTINKGKQHGVGPNMAVITSEGMIGKIKTAYQFTSTVQLLSGFDLNNRISVLIQGEEEKEPVFGLIEGYDDKRKALLLTVKSTDVDIVEGERVFSSGMGGVFPAGLSIGEIEAVEMDAYGLTKIAYVNPAADLYEIDHVLVVDRVMPTPEEDLGIEGEE
ncbi:rod shape-determining protein MreC [Salirhabdus euzebyi]|uniref:Cell shape-determining protein MreC n=1 Tax=Salirhabdus euzebyi TaxID=394506 RepID=A0A841PT05_9BACI|nr:rod shape-determining protein MreC [Salirhabdus euzebyi]MBB6451920.1 rod shape-determining protein MreC [Salirhabdus euzebyi]